MGGCKPSRPAVCGADTFDPCCRPTWRATDQGSVLGPQYTAGYSAVPNDLELAANYLAASVRQAANNGTGGPIGSETLGEYSYTLLSSSMGGMKDSGLDIGTAKAIMARYRDVAI